MTKQKRLETAQETKLILECGEYEFSPSSSISSSSQKKISIEKELQASCAAAILVDRDTISGWSNELLRSDNKTTTRQHDHVFPRVTVINATTFAAALDFLTNQQQCESNDAKNVSSTPCCLNFASAKKPGGGFLRGAQAQEEALARASGLYSTLLKVPKYYEINRQQRNRGFYEDLLIYSPNVPVFRNDADDLIENPWQTSIITMPAPNRGEILKKGLTPQQRDKLDILIAETYQRRIEMVLMTAAKFGHRELVLGAWGCGVFQNNPTVAAKLFKNALLDPRFVDKFDSVTFAVLDTREKAARFEAFRDVFEDFPEG